MTSSVATPSSDSRPPVLYLSHGTPPLADDATWTHELAAWAGTLTKPKRILMVSAHWENAPVTVSSTSGAPLVHDFRGFPQRYYEVTYDAPAAPELAESVARRLGTPETLIHQDSSRGLDHGAYVLLVGMFPDADVPVLQMSMPALEPRALLELGRRLAPLRDEGTLVVGSGFTTHNLAWFNPVADSPVPAASVAFDHWAAETMANNDLDGLFDFLAKAPAARQAHPRTEDWAPLYVALGAANPDGAATARSHTAIDVFGMDSASEAGSGPDFRQDRWAAEHS